MRASFHPLARPASSPPMVAVDIKEIHEIPPRAMSEGAQPVPPRLIKANLRRLIGGHVRAGRLGHYLDFDVVVIPPGRHVTEFPTADAAFHPYEMDFDWEDDGRALEIRLVPWVIFKISANEPLAKKLAVEVGGFWRAGVEQIWEIRAWNRTVALHVPGEGARVYSAAAPLPACPVLPELTGKVEDLFSGGEEDEALPPGAGERGESWRISQRWEQLGERRLEKSAPPEFLPAPPQSEDAADPYREDTGHGGFRGVAETLFGNWTGRVLAGAVALVLLTTMIYLILETLSSSRTGPRIETGAAGTALSAAARLELAKATVRAYFKTDDPQERLEFVRHPEETRPRLLRHHAEMPPRVEVVSVFGSPRDLAAGDRMFLVLPTYIEGRQTDIFLEEIGDAGYLVDWESAVGYNETSFPVFRSRANPEPTEFRVFATESDHYSGAFASSDEYRAVQLHFPESGESALGYMRRSDPGFPALDKAVAGQYRNRVRLVLDLPAARQPRKDPGKRDDGAKAPEAGAGEKPGESEPGEPPATRVLILGIAGDSWLVAE